MGTAYCVQRQDLCIYQGDDWGRLAQVFNGDGSDADLTGSSVLAQLRRGVADEAPTVELEIDAEIQLPNTISLVIPKAETALLSGNYEWDLELTDSAGKVTTLMKGKVAVEQEVTRAVQGHAQAALVV